MKKNIGFNAKLTKILNKSNELKTDTLINQDPNIDIKNDTFKVDVLELEKLLLDNNNSDAIIINKNKKDITNKDNFYLGHRERMRERFLNGDSGCFLDYDILEMLLFFTRPRGDVKPLAKKMIDHFKTIKNVYNGSKKDLSQFVSNPDSILFVFKLIKEISLRVVKQNLQNGTIISNWSSMIFYLKSILGNLKKESLRVLFLDIKYRLITDSSFGIGSFNEITVYGGEIVKKALELDSAYIIMAHNHPSGETTPSTSDIKMTEELQKILQYSGIQLIEHIIIGQDVEEYFSFKENFLI